MSPTVGKALGWLRAGYPEGIPWNDLPPVLGVLRRSLSDDDIDQIVGELARQCLARHGEPVTADDVRELVSDRLLQAAAPADVERVSARLAAAGWPLARDLV
jgi:hypothetical protein